MMVPSPCSAFVPLLKKARIRALNRLMLIKPVPSQGKSHGSSGSRRCRKLLESTMTEKQSGHGKVSNSQPWLLVFESSLFLSRAIPQIKSRPARMKWMVIPFLKNSITVSRRARKLTWLTSTQASQNRSP